MGLGFVKCWIWKVSFVIKVYIVVFDYKGKIGDEKKYVFKVIAFVI